MSAESLTEEQRAQRLRQRLWGATILIAIAVIVLPLLLDGSGSESQFRRVESLRQEPTRVINADGSKQTAFIPEAAPVEAAASGDTQRSEGFLARLKRRFTENPKSDADARQQAPTGSASVPVKPVYDTDPNGSVEAQAARIAATQAATQAATSAATSAGEQAALATQPAAESNTALSDSRAWVVQAGSFREEANALAVRDRLRRDGYPSFVSMSNDGSVFRVRVGPMVNKQQAGSVQNSVMDLLGREAIVMPYP